MYVVFTQITFKLAHLMRGLHTTHSHMYTHTHTVSMIAKLLMYHGYWRGGHEPPFAFFFPKEWLWTHIQSSGKLV